MAEIRTPEQVKNYLNTHKMERGFYRDRNGKIRFLYEIGRFNAEHDDLYVAYAIKTQGMRWHKTGKASIQAINTSEGIFEWFAKADFLGFELPEQYA